MADKILRIMQFASKSGPPLTLIKTVLQKNTKNANMENLKHELLKHDLQVGDKGRGSRMDGTLIDDGDGALLRLLGYSKRLLTRPQPVISRF